MISFHGRHIIEYMSATSVELFDSLTDAQILDEWRGIEAARRELEQRECAVIAQVSTRSLTSIASM